MFPNIKELRDSILIGSELVRSKMGVLSRLSNQLVLNTRVNLI